MRLPRSADVAATMALVLALGGTSYAVTALPRNSVGTTQLKAQAVTKAKLAPGVLTVGPAGPRGLQGPTGSSGQAGPQGVAGPAGGPLDPKRVLHVPGQILGVAPGAQFINIAAPCPSGGIAIGGGRARASAPHRPSQSAWAPDGFVELTTPATDC